MNQAGGGKDGGGAQFCASQESQRDSAFYRAVQLLLTIHSGICRLSGKAKELTKNDSDWTGCPLPPEAMKAFRHLQDKLTQAPILAFPKPGVPFVLTTNGSLEHDFGGLLLQQQEGAMRII